MVRLENCLRMSFLRCRSTQRNLSLYCDSDSAVNFLYENKMCDNWEFIQPSQYNLLIPQSISRLQASIYSCVNSRRDYFRFFCVGFRTLKKTFTSRRANLPLNCRCRQVTDNWIVITRRAAKLLFLKCYNDICHRQPKKAFKYLHELSRLKEWALSANFFSSSNNLWSIFSTELSLKVVMLVSELFLTALV